ncbi:MAG TPA: hypothetical protein VFL54_11480 [Gammaproteobacteria bacterium]|jgi:phosphomevalonate kinase|nr:hypothetical protein [Gammaproteobacteria bacterium]
MADTVVEASAPGKLVLSGEYAVLEGAPAVVVAISRRARVTLTEGGGDTCTVDAPSLGIAGARGRLDSAGRIEWVEGVEFAPQLRLVAAVIETAAGSLGFDARLDTDAFFHTGAGRRSKLGLGSSAAIAVALAAALAARAGGPVPAAAELIAAHRRLQGGRGSGVDIAAAVNGGVQIYRLAHGRPETLSAVWPPGLCWRCIWSGKSASTGEFLGRIAAWRQRAAAEYGSIMAELGDLADATAAALANADVAALLEALRAYAAALNRLGVASGVDIVSREHRTLSNIAADCGVVYKSCGAGGGDIGIALAADAEALERFAGRAVHAGFEALDLAMEPQGVTVQAANE